MRQPDRDAQQRYRAGLMQGRQVDRHRQHKRRDAKPDLNHGGRGQGKRGPALVDGQLGPAGAPPEAADQDQYGNRQDAVIELDQRDVFEKI